MTATSTFCCPSCHRTYPWKAQHAGHTAKCRCGNLLTVPSGPVPTLDTQAATRPQQTASQSSSTPPDKRWYSPSPLKIVVATTVLLLIIVGTLFFIRPVKEAIFGPPTLTRGNLRIRIDMAGYPGNITYEREFIADKIAGLLTDNPHAPDGGPLHIRCSVTRQKHDSTSFKTRTVTFRELDVRVVFSDSKGKVLLEPRPNTVDKFWVDSTVPEDGENIESAVQRHLWEVAEGQILHMMEEGQYWGPPGVITNPAFLDNARTPQTSASAPH